MARSERNTLYFSTPGIDLAALADAGGIDQGDRYIFKGHAGVDGVAGGARDGADDGALLAQQAVEQAGFAGIGLADDGNLDRVFFFSFLWLDWRQLGNQGVQQVAGAGAVQGRDRVWLSHAKLVELQRQVAAGRAVGFVDHQQDRRHPTAILLPLLLAQDLRYFLVGGGDAAFRLGQEQHGIRLFDGQLGLKADLVDEIGRANRERLATGAGLAGVDTAGVDDGEARPRSTPTRPRSGRG